MKHSVTRKEQHHSRTVIGCCLIIFGVALVSGCGTVRLYPGEPRPKESIAVFTAPRNMVSPVQIWIGEGFINSPVQPSAEILPGVHRLTYRRPGGYQGLLFFRAEAGHTYTVEFKPNAAADARITGGITPDVVDITNPDRKVVPPLPLTKELMEGVGVVQDRDR